MVEPIRWCDTMTMPVQVLDNCRPKTSSNHDHLLLVESRDPDGRLLGLLAADQCSHCRGKGTIHVEVSTPPFEDGGDYPCSGSCGGSGHTLRAPTVRTSVLPIGFGFSQEWVAVLPVEQP